MLGAPVLLCQRRGPRQQQHCHRERVHRTPTENTRPRAGDLPWLLSSLSIGAPTCAKSTRNFGVQMASVSAAFWPKTTELTPRRPTLTAGPSRTGPHRSPLSPLPPGHASCTSPNRRHGRITSGSRPHHPEVMDQPRRGRSYDRDLKQLRGHQRANPQKN